MKSYKKFAISFVALILVVVIGIMSLNFFVDPFGYFDAQDGIGSLDDDDYVRELKAEHILKYGDKKYDAYFVCGSKGGSILTKKLKELDGHNYYNVYCLSGNFPDYYSYVKLICENTNAKKILFQISTSEIYDLDRSDFGDIYMEPACCGNNSKFLETVRFLMKNPKESFNKLTSKEPFYPAFETGERNLNKYYWWYKIADKEKEYLPYVVKEEGYTKYMDKEPPSRTEIINQSIEYLKMIKKMCDKHDVELEVFFAPIFGSQMMKYEGEAFYSMMRETISIFGKVHCFNLYNDVTANPYNFYNEAHYFYEIGDLCVDCMAGKKCDYDNFYKILDESNINEEIIYRRKKTKEWKQYYKEHKCLPLSLEKGYVPKVHGKDFNIDVQ